MKSKTQKTLPIVDEKDVYTVLDIFLKNHFTKGIDFLHQQFKSDLLDFSRHFDLATRISKERFRNPVLKKKFNAIFFEDFNTELEQLNKTKKKTAIFHLVEKYQLLEDEQQTDYLTKCLSKRIGKTHLIELTEHIVNFKNSPNQSKSLTILGQFLNAKYWLDLPFEIQEKLKTHFDFILGIFIGTNIGLLKYVSPVKFAKIDYQYKISDCFSPSWTIATLSKTCIRQYKLDSTHQIKKENFQLGSFIQDSIQFVPLMFNTSNILSGKVGRLQKGEFLIELMRTNPDLFNYVNLNGSNFAFDVLNSELLEIEHKVTLLKMFKTLPEYSFNDVWAFGLARSGELPLLLCLIHDLDVSLDSTLKKEPLNNYLHRKYHKHPDFHKLTSLFERKRLLAMDVVQSNQKEVKKKLL